MDFKHTFKTSLHGLRRNKGRSLLTILGIVIGITAIMIVLSVGQSAQELILKQVRGIGSQTIIVEPGREPEGPSDYAEMFTDSLKEREVKALGNASVVDGVELLAPSVMQIVPVSSESESVRTSIMGSSPEIADILELFPTQGNFFSEDDIEQKASVAVLGDHVKDDLFGAADAIGEKIKVKGRTFRVIGVLPPKGDIGFLNVDELVFIPHTTAREYLLGINYFNFILIRASAGHVIEQVSEDIKTLLRDMHDITDPEKDDFHVMTQENIIERVGVITTVLTALLVSVAAISLVVGGVGIMNIMLVSVTERTREIGLRKALGARPIDILTQFLLEAVMLTAMGGVIGIVLGALLSFVAALILAHFVDPAWQFIFPFTAGLLGLGVSAFVGLAFGLYPAKHAAKKSPIEALRYE